MKQEEKRMLIINKENNDESREQAYKEIHLLELSQIQFKNLKNQLVSLMKENQKLKEQIEKLKQKQFKESFKEITKEPEDIKISNCNVSRILHHAEKDRWYTKTDLSKEMGMSSKKALGSLKILEELGKIETKGARGAMHYKLI